MAKHKEGPGTEFPQGLAQHVADLEREALGYQRRLEELDGLDDNKVAVAEAQSGLEAVDAQLRRLGQRAEKKTATAAKK